MGEAEFASLRRAFEREKDMLRSGRAGSLNFVVALKLAGQIEAEERRRALQQPPQPTTGYQKNVTPRGPVARPEDAFPESCCEGGPSDE